MDKGTLRYVYVLASGEADFFPEQTLLSVMTLRRHNPGAEVTLVTDSLTRQTLCGDRGRILEQVDETVVADTPEGFSKTQASRFLKTSLRSLLEGDFLYIDGDTLIDGDLSDLRQFGDVKIGAIFNRHKNNWDKDNVHPQLQNYYETTGVRPDYDKEIAYFFNGGVIYCRDLPETHAFFDKWHELWLRSSTQLGFHLDQSDMWRANMLCGNIITPLPGRYNCQLIYPNNALPFMFDARILHYFASANAGDYLKIRGKEFLTSVRRQGITREVEDYIENFKSDYLGGTEMLIGRELDLYRSPLVVMSRKLCKDFPWLNRMVRKFYHLMGYKQM